MPAHVHSYEESLYVLEGEVVVQTAGEATLLGPGDYGLIPVGVAHALAQRERRSQASSRDFGARCRGRSTTSTPSSSPSWP